MSKISTSREGFSIIIPNYKTNLSFVFEALESVQKQNYPLGKIEVILVDDASPKSYQEKLEKMLLHKFSSSFDFHLILSKVKTNAGSKRNLGVKNAKYNYLIFLDADDTLSLDICKTLNKELKRKKYNLLYADQNVISTDGKKIIKVKRKQFLHKKMLKHFNTLLDPRLHRNFIHHPQIYSKKAFLKVGGYDETLNTAEDIDLLIKVTDLGLDKVCHIPKILYNYRINPHGLTRKDKPQNLRDISKVLKKHLRLKGFKFKDVKYWDKCKIITWFDIYDSDGKLIEVPYAEKLIRKEGC